ncbi:SPOR domain-containing protein [Vibrio sp. JC009]|uniref:SPOR domain-containing protein n=1 Tax=Vibrio sp. JC009 TaxID=2912314 RepID=UPI0023AE837B|nr:SPOR domain-containing protein [Vibrio sp. JC009]WED21880.1 SPOR domain-containing protein [Vibrio sp. JC009]
MKKNLTSKLSAALAIILLSFSQISLSVAAEDEYVCDARQNSKSELPVLSKGCPVGKGLWGKARPARGDDLFWIQCGIYPKPVTLEEAKPIYQNISVDVWLKPEGSGYRCLIGPYADYAAAKKEVVKVRKLPGLEEAFIRAVNTKVKYQPQKKKKVKPASVAPTAKKAEVAKVVAKAPVAAPKPVEQVKPAPKPEAKPAAAKSIVVRREVNIQRRKFVIPFLMESNEQFYMEYNIAWNRLSYQKANEVCHSLDMTLVDESNWKLLIGSSVMSSKQWPLHLPYWGAGKRGLFTSGKVTQLTGTSLLNVVCVQ